MSVGTVDKTTGDAHKNAGNMFDKVGNLTALHTTAKSDAVAAINEVADEAAELESKKANTDMVAANFNAGSSYTAGNYCVQDGKLYKFKNNHSGAWSAADVDEVKITGELSALRSGLTEVNSKLTDKILVVPFTAAWESNVYGYTDSAVIAPLNNGYKLIGVVNNYAPSETIVVGMSYMFVYGFRVATDKSSIIVIADTEYNENVRLDFIYIKVS